MLQFPLICVYDVEYFCGMAHKVLIQNQINYWCTLAHGGAVRIYIDLKYMLINVLLFSISSQRSYWYSISIDLVSNGYGYEMIE